jgi:hypothetical protein
VHWSHVFKRQAGATALACGASCFCSISRRQTHSLVRTIPGVQAASGGKGECFKRFSSVQFSSVQFSSVQFSSVQFSSVHSTLVMPNFTVLIAKPATPTCVSEHWPPVANCCTPRPHAIEVIIHVWQQCRGQPGPVRHVLADNVAPERRSCMHLGG